MSDRDRYEVGQAQQQQQPMRGFGPGGGGGGGGGGGPGGRMRIHEKPKDFKKAIIKLVKRSKRYLPVLLIAFACAVFGAVMTLVGPGRLSDVTDIISDGLAPGASVDLIAVKRVSYLLIVLYVSGSLASYVQGFSMATVTNRFAREMRTDISTKINKLPLRYFDTTTVGNILSRVTNDVDTITMSLNQSVAMLVSSITLILGSLALMIYTNPIMAVAAAAPTVIGFVFMRLIMTRSQKYFRRNSNNLGALNGHIEEIYAGHNVVRAYNGERKAIEDFDKINDALHESNWKSQFLSGLMMPLMHFIGNVGYVAVCVVGGVFVLEKRITFGAIIAFLMYIRNFTQPLQQIAQSMNNLQSAAAAAERVFGFLEEEEMPDESAVTQKLEKVEGTVEFNEVVFGYNPDKTIIHGFSAIIKPGQKVAIVGPTGAGKTTLVNLLMRFYDADKGEIRIDGTATMDLTRENVHSLFGMVLQDTWLFEGTIKENVIYSKEGATDEDVVSACRAVGLHHFIMTLPQGYDTVLSDSVSMSAGQKQLLTIARAMIENAPLLILDEATSSVDTRLELVVQGAMDKLTEGRTSFVIAHRLSTIRNADLILVMNQGDIVESGSHDELIERGGFYATLYNSQFEQAS